MEDGQDRARPTGRPETVAELIARHGAAPTGGRAARRRAIEEQRAPGQAPIERSTTERSTAERSTAERSTAERSTAEATTVERTTALRAAGPAPARRVTEASGDRPRPVSRPPDDAGAAPGRSRVPTAGPGPVPRDSWDATRRPAAAPRGPVQPPPPAGRGLAGVPGLAERVRGSNLDIRDPVRRDRPPAGPGRALLDHPPAGRPTNRAPVVGPARDDIGTGAQDVSEQAERTRSTERTGAVDVRSQRIDETLTRLTAAHAGLAVPRDDEDDEPAQEERPARRRPNAVRLLVLVLTAALVTTTAVGWAAQRWLGSAVRTVAALDAGSPAIRDAAAQKGDRNVLVIAADRGPATVLVAHVPAGGGPMTVLTVPADLQVSRPPCERFDPATLGYTDEVVPALARTRLAAALDAGGPRCATRVVQQLTGMEITAYVGLDLDRVGPLVDAASGVQVCVTRPVQDRVLGPVVPDPGRVTLDGARAGGFVRASEVDGDPPADRGRIERQQQVLAGVLEPTLTSTGLLDLPRIAALRPALRAALTTDGAGLDEVLALARSLRGLGADGVTVVPVPTTAGSGGDAVLRDADAAALFTALRTHRPVPATSSPAGPGPGDVTVQLLNASGRTGAAATTGSTLTALGFRVGAASNADQDTPQTVIRYSPDQAAAADLLAGTIPAATLVPDPGSTGVLQLVLGRSFDGEIRPPSQPAAAATPPATTQSCA